MIEPTEVQSAAAGRRPIPNARRWLRPLLLTFGGLIAAATVGWYGIGVASTLVMQTERDTFTFEGAVRRVEVSVDGHVTVNGGVQETGAVVREKIRTGLTQPDVTTELVDGVLRIVGDCDIATIWCNVTVEIDAPRNVQVDIKSNGADVSDIDGEVSVSSGAGSIDLRRVSGEINAEVGAGSIDGERLTSPRVDVQAGAGGVRLEFSSIPDAVEAHAAAGSVNILVPPNGATYRVDAETGAGSVHVTVATDPTSEHRILARAGGGSASVSYGE